MACCVYPVSWLFEAIYYAVKYAGRQSRFRLKTKSFFFFFAPLKERLFAPNVFDLFERSDRRMPPTSSFRWDARIGLLDRTSFSSPPHLLPAHEPHDQTTQQPTVHSSDAGLTATADAAHSGSAWHILFSDSQQRLPLSGGSSAHCRWQFLPYELRLLCLFR